MTVLPPDLGVRGMVAAVRTGALTPAQLLEAALERRAEVDGVLNSLVAIDPNAATARRRLDGPLAGVPMVVKDSFSLPWWAPRDGMAVRHAGAGNSGVFRLLAAAGAQVFAVANMHQLAIGSTGHISTYGACANPWDTSRCAGGSSSGSAAAVAAGIVPASIGTDGAGSIRIPAAYCGVTGLKPTYGAVPVEGFTGAKTSLAAIGPLTRDADDCRLVAEVLMQRKLARLETTEFVIGVPERVFWDDLQPGVEERCRAALDLLRAAGCRIVPVDLAGAEHTPIAAMLRAGAERIGRIDGAWIREALPLLDPRVRGIVKSHYLESDASVALADRLRTLIRFELKRVFAEVDVLAWPTVPAPACLLSRPRVTLPVAGELSADMANVRLNALANLSGVPALSVPCGQVDGLPVGLMFHAAWGRESTLLDAADLLERESNREFVDHRPVAASGPLHGATLGSQE